MNNLSKEKLEKILIDACEKQEIPGVVAMAADDTGIFYQNAIGKRDLATGESMPIDAVFAIASMTKAITCVSAMQLVEQGKLDLNGDIGDVVPDFKNPLVLESFDERGVPHLRPAKRPVTLKHLMSQTSGSGRETWDPLRLQWVRKFGIGFFGREARRVPLTFDPGDRWAYGLGVDWVGEAIEAVSGQSLEEYFQEHIFMPLGMKDSSYYLRPDMIERQAVMHRRTADGLLESTTTAHFTSLGVGEVYGSGGLFSTAPDYITFLQMLLHGGRFKNVQILKPETVAMMGQNQIGEVSMDYPKALIDGILNDAIFFPDQKVKWGLGFMLNTEESKEGRAPGGMAWWGGNNTFFWVDPTNRLAGVFMTQFTPGADVKVMDLFKKYESALHDRI